MKDLLIHTTDREHWLKAIPANEGLKVIVSGHYIAMAELDKESAIKLRDYLNEILKDG